MTITKLLEKIKELPIVSEETEIVFEPYNETLHNNDIVYLDTHGNKDVIVIRYD